MTETTSQQEYVRTRAAARYLSLSAPHARKAARHRQRPPIFKMGRAVVYAIGDLEAWLAGNRRCSTSDNGKNSGRDE